jgi:Fur family transcriptional regulator, peroxide stress response regulator
MRRTRQRDAILRVLTETTEHPTAQAVYETVRADLPNVGMATVYRLLKALEDEGAVASMLVDGGPRRYDGRPGGHQHIVCTRCGCVVDIPELVTDHAGAEVERWTGFVVDSLSVQWRGVCPECSRGASIDTDVPGNTSEISSH